MKILTLIEVIDAIHLSKFVESEFRQRGGLMLVAPPAALKSTTIELALYDHPDSFLLSDLNVQQLNQLRDDFASGRYRTIGFLEFSKLYERKSHTATNLEGHIRALVEEGFSIPSFGDKRMLSAAARCAVIGAMTHRFYEKHITEWIDSGFARRFLWSNYILKDPEQIMDAIHKWEKLSFGTEFISKKPVNRIIKYSVTEEESRAIRRMIKDQHGQETPFVLMKKILSVLKWKYSDRKKKPMEILRDFAESLKSKAPAEVTL